MQMLTVNERGSSKLQKTVSRLRGPSHWPAMPHFGYASCRANENAVLAHGLAHRPRISGSGASRKYTVMKHGMDREAGCHRFKLEENKNWLGLVSRTKNRTNRLPRAQPRTTPLVSPRPSARHLRTWTQILRVPLHEFSPAVLRAVDGRMPFWTLLGRRKALVLAWPNVTQ